MMLLSSEDLETQIVYSRTYRGPPEGDRVRV